MFKTLIFVGLIGGMIYYFWSSSDFGTKKKMGFDNNSSSWSSSTPYNATPSALRFRSPFDNPSESTFKAPSSFADRTKSFKD